MLDFIVHLFGHADVCVFFENPQSVFIYDSVID